jgi:hypothetical protein
MSNKSNNGTNKIASNKGRRGPRPIVTVGELRARLLREMMVKEVKKVERKISKLDSKRRKAHQTAADCLKQLEEMNAILADYKKEIPNA